MTDISFIIFGCLGGLLPDILRVIKGRYNKQLPRYIRNFNFWLGLILLVALGGLAAFLLNAKGPMEAAAYGFSAPEIISKLAAKTSSEITGVDRGDEDDETIPFDLRRWWSA